MLESRRQAYMKQIANVGLGIGVGAGLKNTLKGGGNSGGAAATVTSKILESALIVAIVAEAGTATYLYRGKIATLIRDYQSANVQQVVSATEHTSSQNADPVE